MRYLGVILLTGLFSFCSNEKRDAKRAYNNIKIERIYTDSVSIRAIVPMDDKRVWFGGNAGKVGLIDGKTPKIAVIRYEDSLMHFRAIAKTESTVFVLSIASPAVLYKIGFDGLEATSMEEVYFEEGEKVFYNAMRFWDEKEGIAMGDPVEDCLSIIVTRDGGNSWQKLPCEILPKVAEGEGGYAASNSNIALFEDNVWIASGGMRSRVFHSTDRGKSWQAYDTPITEGGRMTGIYSIDFYDGQTGIIFGGDWENMSNNNANKAITEDGGKTWSLLSDRKGPGYRSSVKFVPGGKGNEIVAVGSPGISYSSDRGNTWKELSKEGVFAIEFVNDSIAFASGNDKIVRILFSE